MTLVRANEHSQGRLISVFSVDASIGRRVDSCQHLIRLALRKASTDGQQYRRCCHWTPSELEVQRRRHASWFLHILLQLSR
jgi:hypothetical protein